MDPLAELFEKAFEEGRQFLLRKYGLEETGGAAELSEMLKSLSDYLEMIGGNLSLPTDHPWWSPAMTRVATVFTTVSCDDPSIPGWREFLYPVIPPPKEWLAFPETSTGEVHPGDTSKNPALPIFSSDKIPSGSKVGVLKVLFDDVGGVPSSNKPRIIFVILQCPQ